MGKDRFILNATLVGILDKDDERRYELFCVSCPEEGRNYFYSLEFPRLDDNETLNRLFIWNKTLRYSIRDYYKIRGKFPKKIEISVEVSE